VYFGAGPRPELIGTVATRRASDIRSQGSVIVYLLTFSVPFV